MALIGYSDFSVALPILWQLIVTGEIFTLF